MVAARPVSPLQLLGAAVYIAAWPALLFVVAGDVHWAEGWVFATWYVGLCGTVMVWLYAGTPPLLAERYRKPGSGGQASRDQAVVYALVGSFAAWIVAMPLDAAR
jgi:hypothetical protein